MIWTNNILSRQLYAYYKKHGIGTDLRSESSYRNELQAILGGYAEIRTPIGKIDLLTNDLVIEVKHYSTHGNKSAIGQAICYSYYYPDHRPAIALIGKPRSDMLSAICAEHGLLYFYHYNNMWQI